MVPRRLRRVALALLVAVFGSTVFATAAAADVPIVHCAVGYVGGPELVVMTFGGQYDGSGVRDTGSYCADWIGSGVWTGVDKYRDWDNSGFVKACTAIAPTLGQNVVVHVARGATTNTAMAGAARAMNLCREFERAGLVVVY